MKTRKLGMGEKQGLLKQRKKGTSIRAIAQALGMVTIQQFGISWK